ncbi:MAG TPA: DUF3267 domain-containing protein [Saprospiraceae bacterium]|nr:DUF3267 domain-containing protein [Saprospiraceae bacterium]HMP23031.1 DUF3267 domain-containing protein [Saprospiraceae bacterium]
MQQKKPTIAELQDEEQYVQIAALLYDEMIPFLQEVFTNRPPIIQHYIRLNELIVALMLGLGIWQVWAGHIIWYQVFLYIFLGAAIALTVLVPVHEAIHGLAYKLLGAPRISFGAELRKFYFYAVADRFVVGPDEFRKLALAPFAVISSVVVIGLILWPVGPVAWVLWGILLMHTGACAGDFGMLAFYQQHPGGTIFTFDDVPGKVAYFFQEKE